MTYQRNETPEPLASDAAPKPSPCPFCGGVAEAVQPSTLDGWTVHCTKCDTEGSEWIDEAAAVRAWNRRVPAPGAPGQEAAAVQAVGAAPPFGTKRAAALALYRPPFRFTHGYIYDAANQMVADQDGFEGAVETHIAARVRGWGRIGYLPDAAALQDEVGQAIADALTAYWSAALPAGVLKGDEAP